MENLGWVTVFGLGSARCDAPGVEEDDVVVLGAMNSGGAHVIFGPIIPQKDVVFVTLKNFEPTPFGGPGSEFNVPLIIFKK